MMFKSAIRGMENIIETGIPKGSIILVTGKAGTLKSSFAFSMIVEEISEGCEHGLYATLEQSKKSHLRNLSSLGIYKTDQIHIFDYRDLRLEWQDRDVDLLQETAEVIDYYNETLGKLSFFALDSLNALFLLKGDHNLRRDLFCFFTRLKENGLTSILILEIGRNSWHNSGFDSAAFLADGVIELGVVERSEGLKRYIQVKKMRATAHSMEPHHIVAGPEGISILGPIY